MPSELAKDVGFPFRTQEYLIIWLNWNLSSNQTNWSAFAPWQNQDVYIYILYNYIYIHIHVHIHIHILYIFLYDMIAYYIFSLEWSCFKQMSNLHQTAVFKTVSPETCPVSRSQKRWPNRAPLSLPCPEARKGVIKISGWHVRMHLRRIRVNNYDLKK